FAYTREMIVVARYIGAVRRNARKIRRFGQIELRNAPRQTAKGMRNTLARVALDNMGFARNCTAGKADVDELCGRNSADLAKAAAFQNRTLERQLLRKFCDLRIRRRFAGLVIDHGSPALTQDIDAVRSSFEHERSSGAVDFDLTFDFKPGARYLFAPLALFGDKPARRPNEARPPECERDL